MSAFENLEIAFLRPPTREEVLAGIRRDEPCHANPLSTDCHFERGKDEFLLADAPGGEVCEECPVWEKKHLELLAEWEAWVLALQEVLA